MLDACAVDWIEEEEEWPHPLAPANDPKDWKTGSIFQGPLSELRFSISFQDQVKKVFAEEIDWEQFRRNQAAARLISSWLETDPEPDMEAHAEFERFLESERGHLG